MSIMTIMAIMLALGLVSIGGALWLLLTPVANNGIGNLYLIVSLLAFGLLLLIPAKIYIIIRLTAKKTEHPKQHQ